MKNSNYIVIGKFIISILPKYSSNIYIFQNSSKANGNPYYTGNRTASTRRLKYLSGVSNQDPMTRKQKREMLNGRLTDMCYT